MLNAQEAKLLTEKFLVPDAVIVKPYLDQIEIKIQEAARIGNNSIVHPLRGNLSYPSSGVQAAVRLALENLGYTWKDNPNPDPGSPTSSDYTTVSW